MAKLTLANVGNAGSAGITSINANFDAIEAAIENTLSRNGTSPNQMGADLDLNNNDILNVASITADNLIVDGEDLGDLLEEIIDVRDEAATLATQIAEDAATASDAAASATESAFLAQEYAEDAFEISTGVVLASQAEALEGISSSKAMTPLRVMEVIAATTDFIPIRTLNSTIGTGAADDTVALQDCIDTAFALGKGIDLSGLDINIMAPITLRCSMVSSNPSSNGSMIRANTGFVGDYLIDMYADPDPGRHGTLVRGIRFSAGANDISTISTSSPGGGVGTNIVVWHQCHFSNISDTNYCLMADNSGGAGGGTFTGHTFDNCYWFSPMPWYLGDNQDDILFISPRVQLVNATAPTQSPFVTTGNNINFEGTTFLSLDDGGLYTTTTMWQVGTGTLDIGTIFIEDDDVTGHNFPSFFGLYGARAQFSVGPIRLNDEYTGAGNNCVIRWNMGSSDTGNKLIKLRGVTSRGAPASVRPDYLFSCFTNSGLSTPDKYADVYFTVNDEYDEDSLIFSVNSSAAGQGYRSRLHGWVDGVHIERAYQINSAGATPTRRDLVGFNETNTLTITADSTQTIRPGIVNLDNTSGSGKSIGLALFNAESHIRIGKVFHLINTGVSNVTVRNSYLSGEAIAFGGAVTNKTITTGQTLSFMWTGVKFIELVDPA
jgi:hypothetical protein